MGISDTMPVEYYIGIAREYSCYCSLSIEDGPEQIERENILLTGGRNAQMAITQFLKGCAFGMEQYGWWSSADKLTRIIRKIDPQDAVRYLVELKEVNTNIWEYHTNVIQVADQELLEIKKTVSDSQSAFIPPENATAELQLLYNSGKTPDEKISRANEMLPSVEDWDDKDKGFYYYIIGDALKRKNPEDPRRLSFYAAQVYYNMTPTSLGWVELKRSLPELRDVELDSGIIKRILKEHPLPYSLEELLD